MSNTKHTPGPWKISPTNFHDGMREMLYIVTEKGELIAEVRPLEQDLANAKLIAAAPELLEACLLAYVSATPEVQHILSAAIKKATKNF